MDNLEISFINETNTPFDENQIEIPNDKETFEKEIKNKQEEILEGLFSLDLIDLKDLEEKIVEVNNELQENKSKSKKVKHLIGIRNDYYDLRINYTILHKLKESFKSFTKDKAEEDKQKMDEKLISLMNTYEIHNYNEILNAVTYTENYYNQVNNFKRTSKIDALVSELKDLKNMKEIAYSLKYLKKDKEELLKIFDDKLKEKNISDAKDIQKKMKELKNIVLSLKKEGKNVYAKHFEFEIEELEELKQEAIELNLLQEEKIIILPKKTKINKDDDEVEDDESIEGDRDEVISKYFFGLRSDTEINTITELKKKSVETINQIEKLKENGKGKKKLNLLIVNSEEFEKYLRLAEKYNIEDEIENKLAQKRYLNTMLTELGIEDVKGLLDLFEKNKNDLERKNSKENQSKVKKLSDLIGLANYLNLTVESESIYKISDDFFVRLSKETGSNSINELEEYINGLKIDIENNKKIGKMNAVKELEADLESAYSLMKEANSSGVRPNNITVMEKSGEKIIELKRIMKEGGLDSYKDILEAIEYSQKDIFEFELKGDKRGVEYTKKMLEKYLKYKSDADILGLK